MGYGYVLSNLLEKLWREQRVGDLRISAPKAHGDEATSSNYYRCQSSSTCPGVCSSTEVDADEEQGTASKEQEYANPIHLLNELPFAFAVISMLHLEIRWVVKEEQKKECGTVEGKHIPICAPPADVLVSNESIADHWAAKGDSQTDIESSHCYNSITVWDGFLNARVTKLLEARSDAKECSRGDHLVDGLTVGAHKTANDRNDGARHHEVSAAKDIR